MDNVHDDHEEYFVREMNTEQESRLLQEFELLSIGASANAETNHELQNTPVDRVGWVKLLVREMKNASNEDDAFARVSRLFEAFESSIHTSANTEINQKLQSAPMDNVHDDHEEYFVREMNTEQESRLLQEFKLLSIGASANAETNHELQNTPEDRVGWVKLLVREMKNASNEDDAFARVSRLFEAFESSIHTSANTEINQMVEQGQTLWQECIILRKSLAIQQELQKKCEEWKLELQHLKQLVTQYQIGQRTLKEREALLRAAYERQQQVGSYFLNQLSNLEEKMVDMSTLLSDLPAL